MRADEKSVNPNTRNHHLPSLSGIRFFAVFHIFCFHLWVLFSMEKAEGMENILSDMKQLPDILLTFIANGWMSTSFFFLLSGFILAYLYWGPDGQLNIPKRTFWIARAIRIYPIHLLILLVTLAPVGFYQLSLGTNPITLILSAVANLALVQAWFPTYVPIWSWPTWTISALVFLYLATPYLMPALAKLSRTGAIKLLCLLPLISLIPTGVYSLYFPTGAEPQQFWQIFIGSTPIFWLAHFAAGILLTRVFNISAHDPSFKQDNPAWFAWGDIALLLVIIIACVPGIEEPFKFFLRHGLLMPLYMLIIVDLARGKGIAARIFALPGMNFIGETGFSIFIWQNFVMMACSAMIMMNPDGGQHQFLGAVIGMIILAILSTYLMEKPFARYLRRKLIKQKPTTSSLLQTGELK